MTTSPRPLLTAKQVASQLEMAVNTVYLERQRGNLPAEPKGQRRWRWTQEAVDAYRASHAPAKSVPSDLTVLIDTRVAEHFERFAAQLRGQA